MSKTETDTRTVLSPTTGTKIALLVAVIFLVAAAYFYWLPIGVGGANGRFGCQSAANPPTDQFPKNVCGSINQVYQFRAAAMLACGLLTAGLGIAFFGVSRRTETRKIADVSAEKAKSADTVN